MADAAQQLRLVQEELALVESQIEQLLEQQHQLLQKKERLERAVKDSAKATAADSSKYDKSDFPWSKKLDDLRLSVFKIHQFRPLQLQTMNATLSGKDTILIMPTGGGKSLCFHLPALVSKGITLVISPLVSLMEDQVMALKALDARVPAAMLSAASSKTEVKDIQDAMTSSTSDLKLLYVTPEKLAKSKRFMNKLEKMYECGRLARLVIDEVHCCSQWGHDFRPDYKFLGILKRQFPRTPILGLTATATSHVLQDVQKILQIPDSLVLRASFNRTNLYYEVHPRPSSGKNLLEDIEKLIRKRFSGKSGIVYCLTQRDSEEVTSGLQARGIHAGCYHANLPAEHRSQVHRKWISGHLQVVVATIAFGMGIDKPDVRFVIHHSISKSMENYYQESGRAGRDDEKAHCILYQGFGDVFRQSTMVFSEQTGLEKLYGMVNYAYDLSRCRRSLIAQHFGERWDSAQCNQMCDHCNSQDSHSDKDVSSYCRDLVTILNHNKAKKQRVTALKMLDAWFGKGSTTHRAATVSPPKISRNEAERVIIQLLTRSYLKEEFHFTAYSTISYIVPGPRSALVQDSTHTVKLPFVDKSTSKHKPQSQKKTSTITSPPSKLSSQNKETSVTTQSKVSKKKDSSSKSETNSLSAAKKIPSCSNGPIKKPVIVNPSKSHFISGGMCIDTEQSQAEGKTNNSPKTETKSKVLEKPKKRKAVIISDDEDDNDDLFNDLDFGDRYSPPNKKTKSSHAKKCVVIDDSDEDYDDDIVEYCENSDKTPGAHMKSSTSHSSQDESLDSSFRDDKAGTNENMAATARDTYIGSSSDEEEGT